MKGDAGSLVTEDEQANAPSLPSDPANGDAVELSIVMPCLDESETIESCIRKAQRFLDEAQVRGEIVVGDNGSTDGSQDIARRCGARVLNVNERGYGAAISGATLGARGKYVIMGDADDSYDFTNLMPFLKQLRGGYDLVMGNRFQGGIETGAMPLKNRYIGNPILSALGRLFFRCPASDFHCGLRGYSLAAFKAMDLQTTGMEFASEMVVKASLLGMRIAEVPTTLSPDGRSRRPHLRPWRDGWRHLRFLLLYSPRWLFLYPGLVLAVIGLSGLAWLLPGPRRIGAVTYDVHTLLMASIALLLGTQSMAFAVFSKIFAVNTGLLPPNKTLARLFRCFTLEVGLLLGGTLTIGGLVGALYAFITWGRTSFGPMVPSQLLRVLIPSGAALALGFQVVFSSLFLSVLGLKLRRPVRE